MFKLLAPIVFFFLFLPDHPCAQTLGGDAVFNFLRLSNSPQLTALGSENTSNLTNDLSLSFQDPALLRESMHGQISAVFNFFYADIKNINWMMAYRAPRLATNFSLGINYFSYGSAPQTDAAGNQFGEFKPNDYVIQLSASRKYLEHWYYGASLKFISSNYGPYLSSGLAIDFGLNYLDSAHLWQTGFIVKNMGIQLKTYGGQAEDLPFDMQVGITKRLARAPFQFSFTAHHLHRFDILYNDTSFNNENYGNTRADHAGFANKLFQHFVLAVQAFVGDKVELTLGYNFQKKAELRIENISSGLTGFSFGAGVLLNRLQIRYTRSNYQNHTAFNQFGINLALNRYFGLGKWGDKIGW